MEDAFELSSFLPLSYKGPTEEKYIRFLWDAFESNYTNEKFQFAFLAYHMLTMSFVYFNVWQIRRADLRDFQRALIGFSKETEHELLKAQSPFEFSVVGESAILRLLKLIECDNSKIGTYAKLVKDRNEAAHSNGNIRFDSQEQLDAQIVETMRIVAEIQDHSRLVIERCYREFLIQSQDPDDREYTDPTDQIREVLIHENYLSQKDVDICLAVDVESLADQAEIENLRGLHAALAAAYGAEVM